MTPIWIPDLFKEVVSKVSVKLGKPVYFDYGRHPEVQKNLLKKDKSITLKGQKFPLVWLVMDFLEERSSKHDVYCRLPNITIWLIQQTKDDYTMDERRDNTFVPVLYPIYDELLNQLRRSKSFERTPTGIPHNKIDRAYWGADNKNMFLSYIDAVEISGLELFVKNIC
jgi:hypothetical protein